MNDKDDEKIFVTRSTLPDFDTYTNKIKEIWDSHWLTNNGKFHEELTKKLEKYLNVSHVTLFTNGHLALENAIQVMNFKPGSEIITTPFTFVSTTHAIARNGLIPVFCDVKEDDYTIDPSKIESLITDKTCAIIPVHVYGNICDVEAIEKIAKKHNLKVIYDAAHAFGVKKGNESVANFGDLSMFSFHATKVFNTIEGGCLAYNDDSFIVKLNNQKNFGIKNEEEVSAIGGNAKMNEFQAIMGLCNLENLDENIAKRKHVYLKYLELLKDIQGIRCYQTQEGVTPNYAYYPIIILDDYGLSRDELYVLLKDHNIYARKYFYPLTNQFDCYKTLKGDTPIAFDLSNRVLTLPMYPDLSDDNIDRITNIIRCRR